MLSLDDCKALEETATLLRSPGRRFSTGIGKPEPLGHALAGTWSRRIDDEHRIVYKPGDKSLLIAQLRYHY